MLTSCVETLACGTVSMGSRYVSGIPQNSWRRYLRRTVYLVHKVKIGDKSNHDVKKLEPKAPLYRHKSRRE